MIVPALIFLAFNAGAVGADGWGIPMATDIAFAVGIISLLGDRVPKAMKVFLLTLAVVDDVGAIVVIAIFYTSDLSISWSLAAVGLVAVVLLMKLARIWYIPLYVVVGVVLWLAVFESGIHATIAGVALGLICPAHPLRAYAADPCVDAADNSHVGSAITGEANPRVIRRANFEIREQLSVAERLADLLHPFSSYLIIPLFSLFTWLGVRFGIAGLPQGATFRHVAGLALIAGIGFTVSLFITGLAFDDPMVVDEAKLGILGASVIAATLGSLVLLWAKPAVGPEAVDPNEPPHPEPAEIH
jgi:NhaA family Na+:H+ antiporter